ncbi:MAG: hypothetical protein BWK79_14705 [Beggiatoa sp. IS2]|nr:MAG: hypothetical protein BWK79_14705 [Beggiatoa sp. IS2]
MTLRKKTLFIVGGALIGLLGLLFIVSSTILLKGFAQLEYEITEDSMNRFLSVLTEELEHLRTETGDYAMWDDTFEYMETFDEVFIQKNLLESTFESLNLNFIALVNLEGRIVFGQMYNLVSKTFEPIPLGLEEHFYKNGLFTYTEENKGRITGFLLLPQEMMLVATSPILTSQLQGPSRGVLVMGRFFTDSVLHHLSELTHLSIMIQRLDTPTLPPKLAKIRDEFSNAKEWLIVRPSDKNTIAAYTLLRDIYQQRVILAQIEMPREIYRQGLITIHYLNGAVLASALLFTCLVLWLFEKLVLARLAILSEQVLNIQTTDNSSTVTVEGNDELAYLADTINSMIAALRTSYRQVYQAQAETLRLLEENRFLIHRSIAIQEAERRDIARELHDEFGQCITAIQADAETITDLAQHQTAVNTLEKINISAEAILTVSNHMYDVVHSLMRQLRPSSLDDLGLVEALRETINSWQARYPKVQCTFTASGRFQHLEETINITLYRIVQECLTNTAKYAQATRVTVDLYTDDVSQKLILCVQDNGQGMDIIHHKRGLGLIGMRERAHALNGELRLESMPGNGVKITFIIPIAEEFIQKYRPWHNK